MGGWSEVGKIQALQVGKLTLGAILTLQGSRCQSITRYKAQGRILLPPGIWEGSREIEVLEQGLERRVVEVNTGKSRAAGEGDSKGRSKKV